MKKTIKKIIKNTNITYKDVIKHAKENCDDDNEKEYYIWAALDLLKYDIVNKLESIYTDSVNLGYERSGKKLTLKSMKKINKILKGF